MNTPNIVYQSGDMTVATAIGIARDEEPLLPDYNGVLMRRIDYQQYWYNFVALPLNTPLADDTSFVLVDESPHSDAGGGNVRWTRTFARVPNSYVKPGEVYYYSFPGLASSETRTAFTPQIPVWCKIQRDFWLVGAGQTYTTYQALVDAQLIRAQAYYRDNVYDLLSPEDTLDTTTTPTEADWIDKINNGDLIVAEDSKIYRWQGNIFVRDTLYIPAR